MSEAYVVRRVDDEFKILCLTCNMGAGVEVNYRMKDGLKKSYLIFHCDCGANALECRGVGVTEWKKPR